MKHNLMEDAFTIIMIIITILSFIGTMYNIKTGNRVGAFLSGCLAVTIASISTIAIYLTLTS